MRPVRLMSIATACLLIAIAPAAGGLQDVVQESGRPRTSSSRRGGRTHGPASWPNRARTTGRSRRSPAPVKPSGPCSRPSIDPDPSASSCVPGRITSTRRWSSGPRIPGPGDAPVVYAAAAGEKVTLSGGRRLQGGRWGEVNGRKAWTVDIPEVKAGSWRFRQLFVDGERRPRTRLPKEGEYRIESLPGYTGDFLRSPTRRFVYAAGDIVPGWRNLRDVEVVGITKWLDNRLPIESVDAKSRTVTFDRPSLFALLSGDRPGPYWVENVVEALDTPGQWYLDRPQGTLYYLPRPGEEMPSAEIIAPRLSQVDAGRRARGRPGPRPPLRGPHLRPHGMAAAGRLCLVAPGRDRGARRAAVRLRRAMRRHRRRHRAHRQLRRRGGRGLLGHRDQRATGSRISARGRSASATSSPGRPTARAD